LPDTEPVYVMPPETVPKRMVLPLTVPVTMFLALAVESLSVPRNRDAVWVQ
jgi:hypothetical protein